jgi:plastocyanin
MRRVSATLLVIAAIAAIPATLAWGASAAITGTVGNTFDAPTYAHDAGTQAQLIVTGSTHNVTASQKGPDGSALFSSPTISAGSTGVNGTQYLAPGPYSFVCSIHPSTMVATLNVAGTPLPRPTVALKVLDKKLANVVKKAQLRVRVTTTGTETAKIGALLGNKDAVIGTEVAGATTKVLKLRMTKAQRSKLEKKKSAKLKVTGEVTFGSPVSVTAKLK